MSKARWYQNSPRSWVLKEPSRDGGAVLAVIHETSGYIVLDIAETRMGPFASVYAAQRAARKALRAQVEATHDDR